ncbi:dynein regulatory complex subunit 5-like [Tachypleus tridentatus]|uniref:dynein regulatory complex subunit 5-like n=1 Tax=Tachypleus tridentatus TaxID=6853 RepID=UPI003FCFAE82
MACIICYHGPLCCPGDLQIPCIPHGIVRETASKHSTTELPPSKLEEITTASSDITPLKVAVNYFRRTYPENPNWAIPNIPCLVSLSLEKITENFIELAKTICLDTLKPKDRITILKKIPVDLPPEVVISVIPDQLYWKRCCLARWKICDLEKYGACWKRMFVERHLQELIENFLPGSNTYTDLTKVLSWCRVYVKRLIITQLLMPIDAIKTTSGSQGRSIQEVARNRLNLEGVLTALFNLEELSLTFSVRNCGMNFEWDMFSLTHEDCINLSNVFPNLNSLRILQLKDNRLTDNQVNYLLVKLENHPTLKELDLSYNHLEDEGAHSIAQLLTRSCPLRKLNIFRNNIGSRGAAHLATVLLKDCLLETLNVGLNRLEDEGGATICNTLAKNTHLTELNLTGNQLGEKTISVLSKVVEQNFTLTHLDLSCNNFGEDGGEELKIGVQQNKTLLTLDLRLCQVGPETECDIHEVLRRNYLNVSS